METEINLVYLLKEFKRNIKGIIIGGLICALLFAAWGYKNYRSTVLNYGAESKIVAEYSSEVATATENGKYVAKDHGETAQAIVSSDDVLNAAITECDNKMTLDELRGNVYVNTGSFGDVISIIVTNINQDKAVSLCNSITKNSIVALNTSGVIAKLTQSTKPLGTISIEQKTNAEYPYQTVVKALPIVAPSIIDIAKKGILGFVLGLIIIYGVYCVIYIVRGKIIYAGEVEDMGMKLIGTMKEKGENSEAINSVLSKISLRENIENLVVLKYGNDADLSKLQEVCESHNIKTKISENIQKNPFERDITKEADTIIFAIRKGSIKKTDLWKELQLIDADDKFAGVLFVES